MNKLAGAPPLQAGASGELVEYIDDCGCGFVFALVKKNMWQQFLPTAAFCPRAHLSFGSAGRVTEPGSNASPTQR